MNGMDAYIAPLKRRIQQNLPFDALEIRSRLKGLMVILEGYETIRAAQRVRVSRS